MKKEINYWIEDKKNNNVNSKLPNCVAKDYYTPSITKIATKIHPDNADFIPSYSKGSSSADIRANISEGKIYLYKNAYAVIDCGFSLEIPPGYKMSAHTDCDILKRGIFLRDIINEDKRIKVLLINNGDSVFIINHKDIIGKISIEPAYYFEWET